MFVLYFSSIISVSFLEKDVLSVCSRKMKSSISVCHSTRSMTANCCCCFWNQSDFQMVCYDLLVFFDGELCFDLDGNGVKLELGCNVWWLGSVRIFEHRDGHCSVAMVFLFCDAKSYSTIIEYSDCRQHVRWVFPTRSWSAIRFSSFLLLVFKLFIIYILHYIIYTYKSLLILFFSYDHCISFYRKSVII